MGSVHTRFEYILVVYTNYEKNEQYKNGTKLSAVFDMVFETLLIQSAERAERNERVEEQHYYEERRRDDKSESAEEEGEPCKTFHRVCAGNGKNDSDER